MLPLLRIAQAEGRRVEIQFSNGPARSRSATTLLDFSLGLKEQDSLRWYWEDFLEHPSRNARQLASDVEKQLRQMGERLFQRVFSNSEAQQIWTEAAPHLAETRIEIAVAGDPSTAPMVPWELLRDPLTGTVLSTAAAAFTRKFAACEKVDLAERTQIQEAPLRVLMVICQPAGTADAPFRSAARLLVTNLAEQPRTSLVLDVLRPSTFGQLTSVLLEAEAVGEPYHVLHFDGRAVVADIENNGVPEELPRGAGRLPCTRTLPGLRGYLIFDYPTREQSAQLVDGASLGDLLAESRVPLLVLNASQASKTKESATTAAGNVRKSSAFAFETLAQDVLAQGVNAVLEFPYHLGPVASAHYLHQIYLALAQGATVSEAVTAGRKRLQEETRLQISYGPVRREDWPAAILYESREDSLVRKRPPEPEPSEDDTIPPSPLNNVIERAPHETYLDPCLPPRPIAGFLGRDDTIFALERTLAANPIVLLHGEQGAGKTTTAAEFARWYSRTRGIEGPVLYTSFETHKPLSAVLDQLAGIFQSSMEAIGFQWRSMSREDRREVALHVMEQIPILWIWDGVDAITDRDGVSQWTNDEQREFIEFLKKASESQAKFLLTSSRAEQEWLGTMPVRVPLGPLPLWEALQLTRALVEQNGSWPPDIDSWRPLLDFAAGNPLAVQSLVTEALRGNLRSAKEADDLVQLVAGPPADGPAGERLPQHLHQTLSYVLRSGFTEDERPMLGLLHLFRGSINVALLEKMGEQREVWEPKPHAVHSHARRELRAFPKTPPAMILDRMASYGLLRRSGGGVYSKHGALDELCIELFKECFPQPKKPGVWNQMAERAAAVAAGGRTHTDEALPASGAARGPAGAVVNALAGLGEHGSLTPFGPQIIPEMGPHQRARFAYVQALSRFGVERGRLSRQGTRQALAELSTQEPNLRHACRLASEEEWWDPAAGIAEGLGTLYETDGRVGEWEEMVYSLRGHCADVHGDHARPGRELLWRIVTEQEVKISRQRDRLPRAEQLQRLCVDWDRRQAEPVLEAEAGAEQSGKVRVLAESLYRLSEILRDEGSPAIKIEEEAIALRERLGEKRQASLWAFELGEAYTETRAVRDLAQAERWLKRGLELIADDDPTAKAECLAALGRVAWERFNEVRKANAPEGELRRHLSTARQYYQLALEHDRSDDWGNLASHNQQLGHVSYSLGDIDRALPHYRESIRCDEMHGNVFGAAQTRFNLAIALRDVDRLGEARKFARAAQVEFQALGKPAAGMLDRCDKLIKNIEDRLKVKRRERGVLNGA